MTCPHCAHFSTTTFPELKQRYIDTSKVRFIMREFPLDNLAAAASMLARCAGEGNTLPFISVLFAIVLLGERSSSSALLGITLLLGILVYFLTAGPAYLSGFLTLVLPSFVIATAVQTVLNTTIHILIMPIQLAALALLYYDLRIRQEGFDLEMLTQPAPPVLPELSGAPA